MRRGMSSAFTSSVMSGALFVAIVTFLVQLGTPSTPPGDALAQAGPDPVFADAVWVGRGQEALRVDAASGETLFTVDDGLAVSTLAVDELEGVVWSFGDQTLRATTFSGAAVASVPTGLDPDGPPHLAAHGGVVWLGADDVLYRFAAGGTLAGTLPLPGTVRDLAVDAASGVAWAATSAGAVAFDPDGVQVGFLAVDRSGAWAIDVSRRSGDQWLSTQDALVRYAADGSLALEVAVKNLRYLSADGDGGVWAASQQALYRFDADGQAVVALDPLRVPGNVVGLAAHAVDHGVWVATQQRVLHLSAAGNVVRELRFNGGGSTTDLALYTDLLAPSLAFVAPEEGETVDDPRPAIELAWSDVGQGVDASSLVLTLDGAELAVSCQSDGGGAVCRPATDLPEGDVTLRATVADYAGNVSAAASVSFTVASQNRPPVLEPIGDLTISFGSRLELPLAASDPDGDPLTFSVSPLPLPGGARLGETSGLFVFDPTDSAIGVHVVTFTVSDGLETDSETVTLTVLGSQSGGLTSVAGRLLDTNDFVGGVVTPIMGVTVSVDGSGALAVSGPDGRFEVSGVPFGKRVIRMDASTAFPAPDGAPYASFAEAIELIEGVVNDRGNFYLPRIDRSSLTRVDPSTTTTVTNPNLGVTLSVPPGSARNADGSFFVGELSISEVPAALAPVSLPEFLEPGLLLTVQPVGVTFTIPVPVTLTNIDELSPGSETDLWSVNPLTGVFEVVGTGRVSANGAVVETISGGIRAASWHSLLPPQPGSDSDDNNNDNQDQDKCDDCNAGSRTALSSGNLSIVHDLPPYYSLNRPRALRLVYNSERADPRPTVANRVTVSRRAAVPPTVSAGLEVGGLDFGTQLVTDTSGLSESVDETILQSVQFDGSGLGTGLYPYRVKLSSNYSRSTISSFQSGKAIVHNLSGSPFGAGWDLAGRSRLHPQSDGSVLLVEGDGSAMLFQPAPIDLRAWRREGPPSNGNWQVSADGTSVLQTINGNPTFFVSPENFIDTVVRGRFRVETSGDDDYIGFVMGYRSPIASNGDPTNDFDFLLFDWKQNDQMANGFLGREGFALSRVQGTIPNANFFSTFWAHPTANATFQTLATDYGGTKGWRDNTEHDFELVYERNRVKVAIDGRTIFDVAGSFPSGRFGFYNFSQERVRYRSFISSTRFESPPGDFSTLVKNEDGSFTRTLKDGSVHQYDASGHKVWARDTNGNTTAFSYDGDGRLVQVTDPAGLVTVLTYGGDHLESITDPAGRTTLFEHDALGNLVRITDTDGTARELVYDGRHRLVSQRSKRGFLTTYGYDFAGRNVSVVRPDGSLRQISPKASVGLPNPETGLGRTKALAAPVVRPADAVARFVDANGNATVFATDRFGASTRTVDPGGRVTTATRDTNGNPSRVVNSNGLLHDFTFDAKGNLLSLRQTGSGDEGTQEVRFDYEPVTNRIVRITDPDGNVVDIDYDGAGNPTQVSDALGGVTRAAYNSHGQTVTSTNPNGHTTSFTYDAAGNTETITDPLGTVTRLERDAAGRVTRITEALGLPEERVTTFTYDSQNRLLTSTDPTGGTTRWVYDASGNAVEIVAATGEVVRGVFDAQNRLLREEHPARGTTQYLYDGNGNVIEKVDAKGARTVIEYDVKNRPVRVTDALGGVQEFGYDPRGNLLTYKNPAGEVWTAVYDSLDRVVRQTDPLGRSSTFVYDRRNFLVSATNPRGQGFSFTYDALGRLLTTATPDNTIVRSYDPAGNVVVLDDDDSRLLFDFDELGRVSRSEVVDVGVQPGVVTTATFDALGHRVALDDSLGGTTGYSYDRNSRMTGLVTPAGESVGMSYDASGRFTGIDLPNGLRTGYAYDGNGRLSSLEYRAGSGATLLSFSYIYDALGKLLTIAEGARVREYSYDALERLTSGGTAGLPETYTYDSLGRVSSFLSSQYRYDEANQLLEDDDFLYAYDAEGNLVEKTSKTTAETTTYGYDAQSQLVRVDRPDGSVVGYRYDGLGRRIEKDVDGVVTRYVYDHANVLLEFDGTGALAARYSHGPGMDRPLVMERGGSSYYYLADHQGSVRFLTDAAGDQVNTYEYDSFGRLLTRDETVANPFTYTGREYDEETGLYYYRARYYDPVTGRFLRQDPLGLSGGSTDFYGYVGADPVNRKDPSGLLFWDLVDVGFFLWSLHDFIDCPSLETGLGLALDTISLLPIVPSLGWASRADDVLDVVNHADDVADALRHADDLGDIANHADDVGDALRHGDDVRVPCRCFAEGTEVLTAEGEKAIDELRVGEWVHARDEETGEEALAEVIGVFEREVEELLLVDVGDTVLRATPTHRFWVPEKGWTFAGDLAAGSRLERAGGEAVVQSVVRQSGLFKVYDLEIADLHTFLVAGGGFWVHNCDTLQPGPHAGDSVPARGPERDFTQQERDAINEIGQNTGCHTCGTTDPGTRSGDFIPDHQPPNALNPDGSPQQLYPHCLHCSRVQGGQVRQATRGGGG